jgi:hypothetical protein
VIATSSLLVAIHPQGQGRHRLLSVYDLGLADIGRDLAKLLATLEAF